MSQEIIDSLVTPGKIGSDSRNLSKVSAERSVSPSNVRRTRATRHRASIGSLNAGDRATRSATKKSDSVSSSQNVVPHYLRASTGSCHDLCKFGGKHSSEEKVRAPPWKSSAKPLPSELNPVQMRVADEQKNEEVVNHKPLTKHKTVSPYLRPFPSTQSHLSKPKTPLDEGKVVKHNPTTDSNNDCQKPKTSLDSKTSIHKQNKTISPMKKPSSAKKVSSPAPPEIIKSVVFPSDKVDARVLRGSSAASKVRKPEGKATNPSNQHSSVKSDRGKPRKNNEDAGRNMTASKASANTKLAPSPPPAAAMSTKSSLMRSAPNKSRETGNLKSVSSLKVENRMGRDKNNRSNVKKVSEKTLHVVKTEAENNVFELIPDGHAISLLPCPSPSKSLSHPESLPLFSYEEGSRAVEYSNGEPDKHIDQNDESLVIGHVQSVCDDCAVSPLPSSPKSLSLADSSSLLSQEEDNKEIEYSESEPEKSVSESLEFRNMQTVLDGHAVSSFPSSLRSLSHAESSSLLSNTNGNMEIEYSDGEPDKYISGNESIEIGNVQSAPDNHAVSSVPSSPTSSNLAEFSSLLSHEDKKEIEYSDGEPHKFISDNDESLEIGTVHLDPDGGVMSSFQSSVEPLFDAESSSMCPREDHKELDYSDSEPDKCYIDEALEIGMVQSIPHDHDASSCPSLLSPKSSPHTESSSFSANEEDCKEIKYGDVESCEYISENDASLRIGDLQPVCDSHDISSFPSPLSPKSLSNSESSSLLAHVEYNKEIEYSDGESYEYISENDDSLEIGNVPPAEGNHHKTHTKSGVVISEDKHNSPVKLKFRTGKVIELQPDDNGPRRLKFRRSRATLAEDEKVRSQQLKNSEADGNVDSAETSSEKVVLKHQDLQDKKDAQGLLNNVIEQTASKLAESRKSKVKALVGAFETVISLQENKPS